MEKHVGDGPALSLDAGPASLIPALSSQEQTADKRGIDVTALWGGTVIGVERLSGPGEIIIGEGPAARFQIAHTSIPGTHFSLVRLGGAGARLHVAPGMRATIDGIAVEGEVALKTGQVGRIVVGPIEFVVQYSRRSSTALVGLSEVLDFFYSKILAVALILQLGFVMALMITPMFGSMDGQELGMTDRDVTKLILRAEQKKPPQDLSAKKAGRHKEQEGTFGKKELPREDKLASKKGAPRVEKDKREEDRKIALAALAALGLQQGATSTVFGPGGIGSGINNSLGGLRGASLGDAGGAGGLGVRGVDAGGGGQTIGIGGLGSGDGRGTDGDGNVDLGGNKEGMAVAVERIVYEGGLNRDEIQRVLSRVMNQIKHCYEKELNKDPNLEGKVVAFWVISGSGEVSTVATPLNTLAGPSGAAVGQCVDRVIGRLKFPSPRGGGVVNVTYPFVFSSLGR